LTARRRRERVAALVDRRGRADRPKRTGTGSGIAEDDPLDAIDDAVRLDEFLRRSPLRIGLEEQRRIVGQAERLIRDLYVHLPFKRARHAIDPVRALGNLAERLDADGDPGRAPDPDATRAFIGQLAAIFVSLRDLHTAYVLPPPYDTTVAFLPFSVEECYVRGAPRLLVTNLWQGWPIPRGRPAFGPGVRLTHWNGAPVERVIERHAREIGGANPEARRARAVQALTYRSLRRGWLPDEDEVRVTYRAGRLQNEVEVRWHASRVAPAAEPLPAPRKPRLGLDRSSELVRRTKVRVLRPPPHRKPDGEAWPAFGDVARFRRVSQAGATEVGGPYGYLRIFSFDVDPEPFLDWVAGTLDDCPRDGLIIDVRGNPGGQLAAGERLLQFFSPAPIQPETMQFRATPAALDLANGNALEFQGWPELIQEALDAGAVYTQSRPLEPAAWPVEGDALTAPLPPADFDPYNDVGQVYDGPVALIVDALSYSTADSFAAGFEDQNLGVVLGTSGRTGGGGANNAVADVLGPVLSTAGEENEIPGGFEAAIRRTLRVGFRAGVPIEEAGVAVRRERIHRLTEADVLEGNRDLIRRAARVLAGRERHQIEVEPDPAARNRWTIRTEAISRVDVFVDARPALSVDTRRGRRTEIVVPHITDRACAVRFYGYQGGALRASRRVSLAQAPAAAPAGRG
jgi:hypothetical protein